MQALTRRWWIVLICLVWLAGCVASPESRSKYPPVDFRLGLEWAAGPQVKRRASIDAQGLVIVREADKSLRSEDGSLALPVFHRICVYQLHARSIRSLSRWLDQENVKDLKLPADPNPPDGDVKVVKFELVYSRNVVNLVARGTAFGQLRRVLRAINAFLPEQAGFPNGDLDTERAASRVQDVPPFLEDDEEEAPSYSYHRERLEGGFAEESWQRDTFALACATDDWVFAQNTLTAMSNLTGAERVAYQEILATEKKARARSSGR